MTPKPQSSYLLEHKKRLSGRRKAVTFVIGMKCSDGLVLCADSLESDGVTKSYRNKLACFHWNDGIEEWGLCWGGAGHAYVCDKFKDKVKQSFKDQVYNRAAIEEKVEVCLSFIQQSYASADGVNVVMGLFGRLQQPDQFGSLWEYTLYRGSSQSACLSPIRDYGFVGMDVSLAQFFLSNTYHSFMPLEHGKRLALFSTQLMKRHADGVGGDSTCMSYVIGSSMWDPMLDQEIAEIEKTFTLESLDVAITQYWMGFEENHNLNEMTQAELNRRRARNYIKKKPSPIKQSESQT